VLVRLFMANQQDRTSAAGSAPQDGRAAPHPGRRNPQL